MAKISWFITPLNSCLPTILEGNSITKLIKQNGFITVNTEGSAISMVNRVIRIFGNFLNLISFGFLLICVVYLLYFGYQSIKSNLYEIGIITALGCNNKDMAKLFIYGILTGRGAELSNIILDVPKDAFNLLITMITAACFWSGMMKVMESVGIVDFIAKKIKPLFKLIMPNLKDEQAINYVSMNIAANIFGLGYAATPSGLKAVKRMQELNKGDKSEATDEMVTFLVLNTAGVTLIPTSVMAIRASLGSQNPADMLIYPIIATLLSCVSGLIADVIFRRNRNAKFN